MDNTEAKPTPVLDHGYVRLIEHWGSDERVIESARMSTNKGFLGWGPFDCTHCQGLPTDADSPSYPPPMCKKCRGTGKIPGDEKLLRYLYENKHHTPFEFAGMVIEVQAPIFVFREWHRHRTQSYNEMSARYTPLPDLNYVPTPERVLYNQHGFNDTVNKQAVGVTSIGQAVDITAWLMELERFYIAGQKLYEKGLALGIPKELARCPIPVGRYSRMRASTNLRCWLMFLTLRMDQHAQWEIRQFASAVGDLVAQLFPRTWSLFNVTGPTIK